MEKGGGERREDGESIERGEDYKRKFKPAFIEALVFSGIY